MSPPPRAVPAAGRRRGRKLARGRDAGARGLRGPMPRRWRADDERRQLHEQVRRFRQQHGRAVLRRPADWRPSADRRVRGRRSSLPPRADASVLIVGPPGPARTTPPRRFTTGRAQPGLLVPLDCALLEHEPAASRAADAGRAAQRCGRAAARCCWSTSTPCRPRCRPSCSAMLARRFAAACASLRTSSTPLDARWPEGCFRRSWPARWARS